MSFSETPQDTFFSKKNHIRCKGKILNLDECLVMGILNLTPDSFFDGGQNNELTEITKKVEKMLSDGASIIDIGGYSSRPGAIEISEDEELKRVIPVIKHLTNEFPEIVISIDTFRSDVARKSIEVGASIVNDISAGEMDKNMYKTVAELQVTYIMMHMQGTPQNMQQNPNYNNVVTEVLSYFETKIKQLKELGINDLIIDPGFGFGKTVEHNYELLQQMERFNELNAPILVGFSRKSMINKVLGTTPETALNGTTALNTLALTKGANILRVHDVKEAKQAVDLYHKMLSV